MRQIWLNLNETRIIFGKSKGRENINNQTKYIYDKGERESNHKNTQDQNHNYILLLFSFVFTIL